MDINERLLSAFQVEHVEHLEAIRSCLARWESDSDAPDVDEAFRRAHSLKGAARVTGLSCVETLAHHLETLFAQLRSKSLRADRDVLHTVELALDAIEDSAACLLQGGQAPDASRTLEKLDGLLHSGSAEPHACPEVADKAHCSADQGEPRSEHQSLPCETDEGQPTKAAATGPSTAALDTVRLSAENLDRLMQSSGQLLTENLQQDALARELQAIYQRLATIEREWESLKRTSAGPLRRLGSTPELAGLAKYVDLIAHEVNSVSRNLRAARLLQQRSSWSVRHLAEQLQDDVRRARMVPAGSEFQTFRKMMRDLARDQGKEIEFRVTGFEVLADRMVLQALKDPLMHVLRNAVTHGVESSVERQRRGKSTTGLVTLSIEATGNRLTIGVEDDGRGVDLSQITSAAVRYGVLSQAEAATRSPLELTSLLFQPGFSTSREVTEFSGRGMGLSAVYEAVKHLQGEVGLRPRAEAGTFMRIVVPLSLSTHRLLLVSCRGQTIALPFYGIEVLHSIRPRDIESIEGVPMVALGRDLLPVASLSSLVGAVGDDAPIESEFVPLVVMRAGPKRVAVAVDGFIAERNALIKALKPPASFETMYVGGILLEDGTVSLVLNPTELVERFKPSKHAAIRGEAGKSSGESTILVVDDSFTTRTLETSILETNGYRVRVAVDGADALDQLHSEKVDLVISDIQMPRLDGFGLLEAIKSDPRLSATPVIIVSSVDGAEDQERGLSLGADAYIVKRRFDHQELLRVVQQIV
jgi:two-component system, chemotaxis family, sensor kinase CheA